MVRSDGGRAAPRGWCALLLSLYGFDFAVTVRTTPAVACGRGFPSLSKEGSVGAEFRDRNQPWRDGTRTAASSSL